MSEEINNPLQVALFTPEPLKIDAETKPQPCSDPESMSESEYAEQLMAVKQDLIELGIPVPDLTNATFDDLAYLVRKLLEEKSLDNSLQDLKNNIEQPIDHKAIDANSTDVHVRSVEAIKSIRIDKAILTITHLMQHAAAKGKQANLAIDPQVEEEALERSNPELISMSPRIATEEDPEDEKAETP